MTASLSLGLVALGACDSNKTTVIMGEDPEGQIKKQLVKPGAEIEVTTIECPHEIEATETTKWTCEVMFEDGAKLDVHCEMKDFSRLDYECVPDPAGPSQGAKRELAGASDR